MKSKFLFFISLISIVLSQKSGSIFSTIQQPKIVNDDPTDESSPTSSKVSNGAPLTTTSTQVSTGLDQVTPTPVFDPSAENSEIPSGDGSLQVPEETTTEPPASPPIPSDDLEKQQLLSENQAIQSNISQLQASILDNFKQIEKYRNLQAAALKSYAEQMDNATEPEANYLEESSLSYKQSAGQTSIIGDKTTYEVKETGYNDLEITLIMISVIGLGFMFLLLHSIRKIWLVFPATEINEGLYTLLVDSTILVLIWCVTAILEYLDVFSIDIYTILVGLVIFTLFWLILGLWVLFIVHVQSNIWKTLEKKIMKPGEKPAEVTQYLIMRQLFITPVYTAPATENELSPSFNFSIYLSKSLGQIVQSSFRITWIGYFIIISCIIIWRVASDQSELLEIILLWILPGVIFVIVLLFLIKLNRIYSTLVPDSLTSDFQVSLSKNPDENTVRSAIPCPSYLKGRISEDLTSWFLCMRFNPFKLTCAWLFLTRFPNRHELRFWFDSYGPTFTSILIQVISTLNSLWMTAIVLYFFPVFINESKTFGIYLLILGIAAWVINGFILLPKLIISLCLVSKIELMKERSLIEETAEYSKKQMIDRTVKIYRQLKMIYRELKGMEEGEEKAEILNYMKKIAEEVFLLYSSKRTIHATQIDDVLSLLGIRLSEDELRLFAKECSPDKENFVSLKGFLIAIERILFGFELNPADVVKYVLVNYLKKNKKLKISDLNDFFEEWSWHFSDDILEEFLLEAETLTDDSGHFLVQDISNMVKVHVEAWRITERKISQLFYLIGSREAEIERTRELICQNFDFDLYTAFRFFDLELKGSISALDIRDFLMKNRIESEISIIQLMISQYDLNLDGRLSIQEFSDFVLPKTNRVLRDSVSLRTPYGGLKIETQLLALRLVELELALQRDVESLRCEITVQVDFGLLDSFRSLDSMRGGYIDRPALRGLLSRHDLFLTEFELEGLIRRLDQDGDGVLNYVEYVDTIMPKRGRTITISPSKSYRESPMRTTSLRGSSPLRSSPVRSYLESPTKVQTYSSYRHSASRTLNNYEMSPVISSLTRSPNRNSSPLRSPSPPRHSPSRYSPLRPSSPLKTQTRPLASSPQRSYLESSPSRQSNYYLSSRLELRSGSPLKSMPLRNTQLRESVSPVKSNRF